MNPVTQMCLGELDAEWFELFATHEAIDVLLAPRPASLRVAWSLAMGYEALRMCLEDTTRQIDALPQNARWLSLLRAWAQAIEARRVRFWHAAAQAPLHTRLLLRPEQALVFAGPLGMAAGGEGRELLVALQDSEFARASRWMSEHLARAQDISAQVRDILDNSWAGHPVAPAELYYRVLSQYFRTTIEGLDQRADDNPLLEQLTTFQREAYHYARSILGRYGGVFLADVVGLGKTFIAMALLRHLQDRYAEHAVVVGPPAVLEAWRALAADFRVELQTVSIGKLEDLERHADREILVIDESHNFRNRATQRYERLQAWLRPQGMPARRKVILLSATPQNNHPDDVKHQLALFPDNFARLPVAGESLDAWFAQVRQGRAQMTELLQHVVVRRTRRFIQAAYPDATLRVPDGTGGFRHQPLRFPQRQSGLEQCLRYGLDSTYGAELYEHTLRVLAEMHYVPYSPAKYLTDRGCDDARTANVRRAGQSMRGLIKVLLLKRLESSMEAFSRTLETLCGRMRTCLQQLDKRRVMVRQRDIDWSTAEDDDAWQDGESVLPAELFDHLAMRRDLTHDLAKMEQLQRRLEGVRALGDGKLQRLRRYLAMRPPTRHRTIIFTQFADTARYLAQALGEEFGRTALVTGSHAGAMNLARRFSPRSMGVQPAALDPIHLLISTDALSEGVNLQDADTLINYDLHWNPVRLIQRAGRIDRIGSEHAVIEIASFLPEKDLESALGLETVLRRRIEEFLRVFGEDSQVLPAEEEVDHRVALTAYTGAALEEPEDEELDGLSRHVERLLQLCREQPALYGRALELRPGRHAFSHDSRLPTIGAARLGWFWRFYAHNPQDASGLRELPDLEGLDALWRHAEAGPREADLLANVPVGRRAAMGQFLDSITRRFTPQAEALRDQLRAPRQSAEERFVIERLSQYLAHCPASRRDHVREVRAWVEGGHAQTALRRAAKAWKRDTLPAETVFNETRVLFARYPAQAQELGDVEVLGAVSGLFDGA